MKLYRIKVTYELLYRVLQDNFMLGDADIISITDIPEKKLLEVTIADELNGYQVAEGATIPFITLREIDTTFNVYKGEEGFDRE